MPTGNFRASIPVIAGVFSLLQPLDSAARVEERRMAQARGGGSHPISALLLLVSLALPIGVSARALPAQATEVLAEVDGESISREDVDKALGAQLSTLEKQIYDLRRQKLEAMIDERLLAREAAKRRVTVQALLESEVTTKVGAVSDAEVEGFYQATKSRLTGDEAQLRERIRAHLLSQKVERRRAAFLQALRSETRVAVHLSEPPVYRAQIAIDGAPFRGGEAAPVTIVAFSDFHCPFCKRVNPTLAQVMSRYGDRVRLVFRDFPLDKLHPQARRAAEAGRCAKDQGKFWEYHDLLFANAPSADSDALTTYARQAGLDVPGFERCISSSTHAAAVQRDIDEAIRLGLTGTPNFFINGRPLVGAQPLESFVRMIDEELRQAQ